MKVRSGFVSNSSSSSFVVVGKRISLDPEKLAKAREEDKFLGDDPKDFLKVAGLQLSDDEDFHIISSRDFRDEIIVGFGNDDLSEYDWNGTSLDLIQRWIGKAGDYFQTMNVKLHSGIVNPGH